MANTGHVWGSWNVIDAAIVLTQGGTVTDTSATIDLGTASGCEISIDTDYSAHALATAGLGIYILRTVDDTDFEDIADNPWGFEMVHTNAGTNRRVFSVAPAMVSKFQLLQVWGNTTGSSVATTATAYRVADVPVAS